jgi:hypothetical protein
MDRRKLGQSSQLPTISPPGDMTLPQLYMGTLCSFQVTTAKVHSATVLLISTH